MKLKTCNVWQQWNQGREEARQEQRRAIPCPAAPSAAAPKEPQPLRAPGGRDPNTGVRIPSSRTLHPLGNHTCTHLIQGALTVGKRTKLHKVSPEQNPSRKYKPAKQLVPWERIIQQIIPEYKNIQRGKVKNCISTCSQDSMSDISFSFWKLQRMLTPIALTTEI